MIHGEKDWVYGIECRGRRLMAGEQVSIELPLTLVIGEGFDEEEDSYMDAFFETDGGDSTATTDTDDYDFDENL